MRIPDSLRPFAKPTLIVATDNVQATIYLADGEEVNKVAHLSAKADELPGERSAVGRGSGDAGSAEPEDDRLDWSRERLYEELNTQLMRRLQDGEFEDLAFTAPHDVIGELKETLHIDLLKRAIAFVPKNLMKEELVDLVTHVQEEM